MRGRRTPAQGNGTSWLEAEGVRCARLSVWENEGGGLGPLRSPLEQGAEVVFDGPTILTSRGDGLRLNRELIEACRTRLADGGALAIQLYGRLLSAGRGELDLLLREIEARAAEGWEARVAAASPQWGKGATQ